MDVLDAHELEADVGVVVLILVAFARRSVGQRVQLAVRGRKLLLRQLPMGGLERFRFWRPPHLWPGVHDVDKAAVVIGLHDGLQHALVLQASCAEPGQRLTAPAHGRLEEQSHSRSVAGTKGPSRKDSGRVKCPAAATELLCC